MRLTKDFTLEEFRCPCCSGIKDSLQFRAFVSHLQEARQNAGVPFLITSGYRCPKHNKEVGGINESAHTKGVAADIHAASSSTKFAIIKGLLSAGFRRIGISKTFIHADMDVDKPQNMIWTY